MNGVVRREVRASRYEPVSQVVDRGVFDLSVDDRFAALAGGTARRAEIGEGEPLLKPEHAACAYVA